MFSFIRLHFYKILFLLIFALLILQYSFNMVFFERQIESFFYFNISGVTSFEFSTLNFTKLQSVSNVVHRNTSFSNKTASKKLPSDFFVVPTTATNSSSQDALPSRASKANSSRTVISVKKTENSNGSLVRPSMEVLTRTVGDLLVVRGLAGRGSDRGSVLNERNSTADLLNITKASDLISVSSRDLQGLMLCPPVPPKLVGPVEVWRNAPPMDVLEKLHSNLELGGRFHPQNCTSRHRVAIIIPYRDRPEHLRIFLHNMHPVLKRQQIDYGIFVVEQSGMGTFNRAMLMNIGALEAVKQYDFQCFIFHDVDLLPEDDRNLYTCPEQPRHMSVAINTMGYRLPYTDIFGGVSAMSRKHFELLNGFSNKFWGWGGEDDDMSNRIKFHGLHISRYPANIARYFMLSHKKDKPNPKRYEFLYNGKKRFKTDGLNSVKYKVLDILLKKLYTWIYVELANPP